MRAGLAAALAAVLALMAAPGAAGDPPGPAPGAVRVAQFNAALVRTGAGLLLADIGRGDMQARAVAEIVLRVRPDVLLINELDADPEGRALAAFAALLAQGVAGLPGLDYPHRFQGPQNVGEPSGLDLDGDGRRAGPRDAWGFGRFPGQYAMAVLSRLPVAAEEVRSYRLFRWAAMPGARRPVNPDGTPYHADAVWQALRLSSKAHWDLPFALPGGGRLHLLAAHPTPPVFDGPEDLNGRRNGDEIRLIAAMIDGADWLRDDAGRPSGLPPGAAFVVAGDLNADPQAGEGDRAAIRALLAHPRLTDPLPASEGGREAGARGANPDPAGHTADWPDPPQGPGNLRVDYVLPSAGLRVTEAGVFWPERGTPLARLVSRRDGGRLASSDHRLVWVDVALP